LAVSPTGFYFFETLLLAYVFMTGTFAEIPREGYPLPAKAYTQAFFDILHYSMLIK
jgi:hypothetical protein